MTQPQKPKAIILESDDTVREHAESVLSRAGWEVVSESVSQTALETLTRSKKILFALFISNFKLPKMEGDDILQKVKAISPLTQRLLMIPADKPDTLISAINKANINACITAPFKDEDLIDQADACFKAFKHSLKRERLKRVTVHQNQQMFKIAQKLKKKDALYKKLIDEKNTRHLKLKSKNRNAENTAKLNTDISLSSLMTYKEVVPGPDTFKTEFIAMCSSIQDLFKKAAAKNDSDPIQLDWKTVLSKETAVNSTKDEQETESELADLIEKTLKSIFTRAKTEKGQKESPTVEMDADDMSATSGTLDEYFDISISETQTTATIKKIKEFDDTLPGCVLSDLMELLRQKEVSYGILDDETIETWISKSCVDQIIIARGEDKIPGQDGTIKFNFETPFTNPGKINEDGSIDFRDRGDIPYVSKDDLLAVKTPMKEGRPGISVSGTPIPVDEVSDPVFTAGPGTQLSEDGLSIHAAIDGEPHRDAMGTISVNPDLVISGDVDFETGNIDFKGNIIVKGMVKEGFTVKGISLTAQEIEGGTIDLTGDLNVSAGITDSTISAHGNIYAKFINHSTIMGFEDLVVSKEIIDSSILLSGSCKNSGGHIISSKITAKMGIEAGSVGTSSSKPAKLKIGVDEHVNTLKKQITEALEFSVTKSGMLKDEIKKREDQDQELYQQISEKAHTQDRAQVKINELKKSLADLKKENDATKLRKMTAEIKELTILAQTAEKELNTIFKAQDKIANEIEQLKNKINLLEVKNQQHVIEKKALEDFAKKNKPLAVITVAKTITQDSIIKGPHASLILKEDASRCKVQEITLMEEDRKLYDMVISDG